jgi:hypothetical protein
VAREMTATPEDHTHVSDGDILIADELARRPARSPDLAAENDALHALARLLIDDPDALPRQLAEIALELCDAGSAGVSLLEERATEPSFVGRRSPDGSLPTKAARHRATSVRVAFASTGASRSWWLIRHGGSGI